MQYQNRQIQDSIKIAQGSRSSMIKSVISDGTWKILKDEK
jgi:hypothetical protein